MFTVLIFCALILYYMHPTAYPLPSPPLHRHFEGFVSELAKVSTEVFPALQKTGSYLAAEKYEGIEAVKAREASIASGFEELKAQGDKNEPVLQDNLKREVRGHITCVSMDTDDMTSAPVEQNT